MLVLLINFMAFNVHSQQNNAFYTAEGYWKELEKKDYKELLNKKERGDSLTKIEKYYLIDYETYLESYYERMSEDEKNKFAELRVKWDQEILSGDYKDNSYDFEWKFRDRFLYGAYGLWYGTSLVLITEAQGPGAAAIPLITSGLWLLGPIINSGKYEYITRNTLRMGNTGRFFGLGFGGALATALAGHKLNDFDGTFEKVFFGLSTAGSIALGEIGFHYQKRRNLSSGHIEMIRHYGVLGSVAGLSIALSQNPDASDQPTPSGPRP